MKQSKKPTSITSPNERDRVLIAPDPYVYEWTHAGTHYKIEIEAGFKYRPTTTFLPRPLIELLWGRYALEDVSLPHDYTWRRKKHWEDGTVITDRKVPKAAADAILFDGDDKTTLRWGAWILSMTVGWILWYDLIKDAKAWVSDLVT